MALNPAETEVATILLSNGFSYEAAAALMGNMANESGMQPGACSVKPSPVLWNNMTTAQRNAAWGLFQWYPSGTKVAPQVAGGDINTIAYQMTRALNADGGNGMSIQGSWSVASISVNYKYVAAQMTHTQAQVSIGFDAFKGNSSGLTLTELTYAFLAGFERPGSYDANLRKRAARAAQYLTDISGMNLHTNQMMAWGNSIFNPTQCNIYTPVPTDNATHSRPSSHAHNTAYDVIFNSSDPYFRAPCDLVKAWPNPPHANDGANAAANGWHSKADVQCPNGYIGPVTFVSKHDNVLATTFNVGDEVVKGTPIARMGTNAIPPVPYHLHFVVAKGHISMNEYWTICSGIRDLPHPPAMLASEAFYFGPDGSMGRTGNVNVTYHCGENMDYSDSSDGGFVPPPVPPPPPPTPDKRKSLDMWLFYEQNNFGAWS
jgi:hypothetical protein